MFTKNTTLGEVLKENEKYADILMGFGLSLIHISEPTRH